MCKSRMKRYSNVVPKDLYDNINKLLFKKGYKDKRLIKDLHLGVNTMTRWKEFYPRVETLMDLANYFGVTVDELLIRKDGE